MADVQPTSRRRTKWLLRALLLLAIVGAIGAGGTILVKEKHKAEQSAQKAAPKPVLIGVGALGRLEPGWKIIQVAPASSPDGARLEQLNVEEGDWVEANQVLGILDTQSRKKAAMQEADAQVLLAKAKLAQVHAGMKKDELLAQEALISKLKVALKQAQITLERTTILQATGAISSEENDLRRSEVDSNRELLKQAQATLEAMKTIRPEDIAAAQAEVARAEANVARAKADFDTTIIRAPLPGRILKLYARPGERIADKGIADMGNTNEMHAVAEVYESDAPKVKVGQSASVKVQSLPGELKGEVVQVGWKIGRQSVFDNDPVRDTDARVVEVRIKLDLKSSEKVAGLTYARIETRIDTTQGK